jgi:uncharacterized protein (TIGR02284 family)
MARIIREVVALLNRLIQLEFGAIAACKAAFAHVTDAGDRERLASLLGEHRRHVDELTDVVRNLGGEPSCQGDLGQVVARGRAVLGALAGERALLEAMRGNEAHVAAAYESAVSQPGVPVDVLVLLERHLDEERRHGGWIAARLDGAAHASPGAP